MPDRKTYRKDLVDRGWSEMKRILDREMPQKKDRRPGFIWLGVMVLAFAGFRAFQYTSHTLPHDPHQGKALFPASSGDSLQANREEAREIPAPHSGEIAGQQDQQFVHRTKVSPEQSHPASGTSFVPKSPSLPANHVKTGSHRDSGQDDTQPQTTPEDSKDNRHGKDNPGVSKARPAHLPQATFPDQTSLTPEKTGIGDRQSGGEDVITENSGAVPLSRRDMVTPAPLPHAQAAVSPEKQCAFATTIVPLRKKKGFGLDVFGRTHMSVSPGRLYGAEGGISAVFRRNARVQLRTGLSYGYYDQDGLIFKDPLEESLAIVNNPGNPSYGAGTSVFDVYSNRISYDSAILLTEKFHYLHIPMNISYRISDKISITGGARASVLLGAPAKYRLDETIFQTPDPFTPDKSNSFLYDYGILRKFDIAPEIGINWQLMEGLWIDVGYKHGLVPYINRSAVPERSDYHRNVNVGLRLRIM